MHTLARSAASWRWKWPLKEASLAAAALPFVCHATNSHITVSIPPVGCHDDCPAGSAGCHTANLFKRKAAALEESLAVQTAREQAAAAAYDGKLYDKASHMQQLQKTHAAELNSANKKLREASQHSVVQEKSLLAHGHKIAEYFRQSTQSTALSLHTHSQLEVARLACMAENGRATAQQTEIEQLKTQLKDQQVQFLAYMAGQQEQHANQQISLSNSRETERMRHADAMQTLASDHKAEMQAQLCKAGLMIATANKAAAASRAAAYVETIKDQRAELESLQELLKTATDELARRRRQISRELTPEIKKKLKMVQDISPASLKRLTTLENLGKRKPGPRTELTAKSIAAAVANSGYRNNRVVLQGEVSKPAKKIGLTTRMDVGVMQDIVAMKMAAHIAFRKLSETLERASGCLTTGDCPFIPPCDKTLRNYSTYLADAYSYHTSGKWDYFPSIC